MSAGRASLVVFVIGLATCVPASAARNGPADVRAIGRVVESFRVALSHKDKAAYMDLFFFEKTEDIGWQFFSEDAIRNRTLVAMGGLEPPTPA